MSESERPAKRAREEEDSADEREGNGPPKQPTTDGSVPQANVVTDAADGAPIAPGRPASSVGASSGKDTVDEGPGSDGSGEADAASGETTAGPQPMSTEKQVGARPSDVSTNVTHIIRRYSYVFGS